MVQFDVSNFSILLKSYEILTYDFIKKAYITASSTSLSF